jgi:hypothetical protein
VGNGERERQGEELGAVLSSFVTRIVTQLCNHLGEAQGKVYRPHTRLETQNLEVRDQNRPLLASVCLQTVTCPVSFLICNLTLLLSCLAG